MPLLFSLGIHAAFQPSQQSLRSFVRFLGRCVTRLDRVAHCFSVIQEQLRRHSNIRVHLGKVKNWNASGVRPRDCDILQRIAAASDSRESVWKCSDLPADQQGIKVLGTPLGPEDFVAAHLEQVLRDNQTSLEWILMVQDVQCAWALLLHIAASRANYQVRVVRPELTVNVVHATMKVCGGAFATFFGCIQIKVARDTASLPLALGGLGVQSVHRSRQSACWASWATLFSDSNVETPGDRGGVRICFFCCCFAVFVCRSLLLCTHADVATAWNPFYRAARSRAGLLARRVAGARVTINIMIWDLDLAVPKQVLDGRRLEVVVEGFPCLGGRRHFGVYCASRWNSSLRCSPH